MAFQIEYPFTLPYGFVDADGTLHKDGIMRLATAADEIIPMRDSRVQQNPSYLTILVLSRVITRLGTKNSVGADVVEKLFARDLSFLNDMYERLNGIDERQIEAVCPECGCKHQVALNFTQGGISVYPQDELFREITFIAYYLHWPQEEIWELTHEYRRRYCAEISDIHSVGDKPKNPFAI